MQKKGKETVLTAYIILITVGLLGGLLTYSVSTPTGSSVLNVVDSEIAITSFDAVFDPDGVTSIKLVAAAKENIQPVTGKFWLTFESGKDVLKYEGFVFFDGAFGEIQSLKLLEENGDINIEQAKGTVVVTNAIDDTASVLLKLDFKRPLLKNIFVPPRKLLVYFDIEAYDRTFVSKVLPIRHAERPNPFPYYLNNFGVVEIKA